MLAYTDSCTNATESGNLLSDLDQRSIMRATGAREAAWTTTRTTGRNQIGLHRGVLAMIDEGLSYRAIGKQLDMNARLPLE